VTHDHPVGGGIFGDPASAESIRRYNDFLVAHVDQIVRGIVGPAKPSYLSDNQQEVYTDYAIIDPVILYQAKVTTSTRPGVMPTATATIFGGTITIHGLSFTSTHDGLRALKPGVECLFLLERIGVHHFIVGKYFGVFRIRNGVLTELTDGRGIVPAYKDAPVNRVVEQILALLPAAGRQ
jgi:hypothetical protein